MIKDIHWLKSKDSFVIISVGILFVNLLLLCVYLFLKVATKKESPLSLSNTIVSVTPSPWEVYTNPEFGISFEVPRLLLKQDIRNSDGYIYTLFFGENAYSGGRGVGFAVTDSSLEKEVSNIKSDYAKDENAKLEKEIEIEVGGEKGKLLSYRPKEENQELEERDVLIFNHGKYTFTISTEPSQMEQIIKSFKFI